MVVIGVFRSPLSFIKKVACQFKPQSDSSLKYTLICLLLEL